MCAGSRMFGGGGGSGPKDTSLYDTLNVAPSASQADIKKSYFKLAKEYHPDKNPEHGDRFKEISFAYEILSNPEKRKLYDMRGIDGIKKGGGGGGGFPGGGLFSHFFGGGGGGMDDDDDDEMGGGHPFSGLFGGMGGMRGAPRRRKFQDTVHPLNVTLEEMYSGKTSKLKLSRKVLCKTCHGSGGKPGQKYQCSPCKGRGIRTVVQQIGPGMLQQMQVHCDQCKGTGGKVPEGDKCKACHGDRYSSEQKILEVNVQPGIRQGDKVVFRGEGDQSDPDVEAGDVVIVIQQKEHELFQRDGDDLHFKKTITLNEALCGFKFLIKHIDGHPLIIRQSPGEVIKPETVKGVVGKGMPNKQYPELKGNLFVHFEVDFPEDHFFDDDKKYALLQSLLPTPKQVVIPSGATELSPMEYDEKKYGRGRGGDAYNEDSDEDEDEGGHGMHGGQGVRCQQQ
ncbi:unnamed protein product [Caenorhabditis angaria]|uniref:Uncharacterized protein n=1 Tax=Caenorhabditis angaria TaxID=860376 RepID=A0A9P1J0K9_9PELO|nr:unnamed protein product [Caenorhabditis angaria]